MTDEKGVVAAIGLPGDVEGITEEGDRSDDDVDREVDDHADEGDVGHSANPGGEDQDAGGEAGQDVADGGDEADDTVEPEADLGSGDTKGVVEEMGEEIEIFVAEKAATRGEAGWLPGSSGRQHFGLFGRGHVLG